MDFALLHEISLPSYLHRTDLHVENGVSGRCQGTVNFSCFRSEPDGQNHPPRLATTARVPKSLSKGNRKLLAHT